jgi:hypothetical protein
MMLEVEPPGPDGPLQTRLFSGALDTRSEHLVGLPGQDECMIDDPSPEPRDSGTPSAQAPESYFWPLVALVLVILPQVLVPGRLREGPPLIVPVIEAIVFLALLAVAAKPGPVPRAARPLILSLFAVLVLANSAAAARLVVVVLRTPQQATPRPL